MQWKDGQIVKVQRILEHHNFLWIDHCSDHGVAPNDLLIGKIARSSPYGNFCLRVLEESWDLDKFLILSDGLTRKSLQEMFG